MANDSVVRFPSDEFTGTMHRWQREVLDRFDRREARFWMLKWHRRARKTTLALNLLLREAATLPNRVYGYVAPTYTQARAIVWRDPNMLFKWLPAKKLGLYERNDTEMFIRFWNGSMLVIKGADNPDSLRGLDFAGVVLDEWGMFERPAVWPEIIRPVIAQDANRWAMFIYTPLLPHALDMWNHAEGWEGWYRHVLRASESALVPAEELARARAEMPPEMYDREFECADVTEEESTLITSAMLEHLKTRDWSHGYRDRLGGRKRIVSVDPAFGGDACVMLGFHDTRVVGRRSVFHQLTAQVVAEAKVLAREIGTKNFVVDCVGNGKGVADGLASDEAGYHVQYFNAAESKSLLEPEVWSNLKTEACASVADLIRRCEVEPIEDVELCRQLVAMSRYKGQSNGRTRLISNDEVRKLIGRSPDDGSAYINGIWGLQHVEPVAWDDARAQEDSPRYRHQGRPRSPMVMA